MEIRSKVSRRIVAAGVGLGLGMGASMEVDASSYRYLCTSIPTACSFAPPTAPALQADVCWSEAGATLKGAGACPSGSHAFFVEHGDVDPVTHIVSPYVALNDACAVDYCVDGPSTGVEDEMCCTENGCVPYTGQICDGEIVFCYDAAAGGCVNGSQ